MRRKKVLPSVIVDTNIFVSGIIIKKGNPYSLLQAWRNGLFLLLISKELYIELQRTLNKTKIAKNYNISQKERNSILRRVSKKALLAVPTTTTPISIRDPKDQIVLAAALGGKADYLITGDKDLLILKDNPKLKSLKIVTVKEFLEMETKKE